MFKNDLYVTEISLQDFIKLHLSLKRLVMDRSTDPHKYAVEEEDAHDLINRNLEFYKNEGFNNVLFIMFKGAGDTDGDTDGDTHDEFNYIKYYTDGVQNYVVYPGCEGVYRKRGNMTFVFDSESFYLPMNTIKNVYLVHLDKGE